jgi:hypothetical protein
MAKKSTNVREQEEARKRQPKSYVPRNEEEKAVLDLIDRRSREMKEFRKNLKIEEEWKEADAEYVPEPLTLTQKGRKRFEADPETGLRSRLVPVGGSEKDWRNTNSDPALLVKIQTALSIIIEKNPEAVLTALTRKHEKTTAVAYSLWKRNWEITNSKDLLKRFVTNLMKYGWAVGRSYPRLIKTNKKILKELDTENPENNKYETKEIVYFNDVYKENMDPYRTWIDEQTRPYEQLTMNDCYYEVDRPYDLLKLEFQNYPNWQFVAQDSRIIPDDVDNPDKKDDRKDIVTCGYYENRFNDVYGIWIPKQKIVLYSSPLPNDEGMLSLWHTPWILRSADSPYGLSLWKVIKQDKELYDKAQNMTMDQLVLSIYKMFFYTGTNLQTGDGKIKIEPGVGKHVIPQGSKILEWLEVPGPGPQAFEGLKYIKSKMDDSSGITPTLEGEVTGKTLGEILHAKESALKRMRIPLENISEAIEQDAYVTLSWMSQIYSIPDVREFADIKALQDYETEEGVEHSSMSQQVDQETGEPGKIQASFLPELSLHLEDRGGQLYESKESKFFKVGEGLPLENLRWRGIFRVIPKSVLSPSFELEKQRKMELFNILVPLLGGDPAIFKKSVMQILKVNEEDPDDWLPDSWTQEAQPLFVPNQTPGQGNVLPNGEQIIQPGQQSMQGNAGTTPNQGGQTVVPQNQIQNTPNLGIGPKSGFQMK